MNGSAKPLGWSGSADRRLSLLQRNELLEMAEEVASVGHWHVDLATGALYWSDEVYRIHDVSPEDYTPDINSAIDFYHPEDAARVSSMLDRAISDRRPFEFEFRLVRPDGDIRLVHSRARIRVDENDDVVAVFGIFQDVTLRKRQESLRQELLNLSLVEDMSPDEKIGRLLALGCRFLGADAGFVESESDGLRTLRFAEDSNGHLRVGQTLPGRPIAPLASDANSHLLKLSEHLGRVCDWLGDDVDKPPFAHGVGLRLIVNGRPYGSVWFVTYESADDRAFEAEHGVVRELGQFVSYELGAWERHNELVSSARTVRQKQQELDLLLDTVPSRIWYKDGNNRILFLNKQAARSMGVTRQQAEGADSADLFPEMGAKYLADDLAVIDSGQPRLGIVEKFTPRDGQTGWVSTDKIPFVDEVSGEPRILAVATDITPLMQAHQELEDQADQLRRTNDDLDQFAHVVAHDLRTPLRGIEHILNWLDEDLAQAVPSAQRAPFAEKLVLLKGRVARMSRMLSDMLMFARATHSQTEIPDEPTDVNGVIRDIIECVDAPDTMSIRAETVEFELMVSPTQLQQILSNLITNGIRHHDRAEGRVTVTATCTQDLATIAVTDDGPGIDEPYHERVFDAFATLKRRDEVDSTGVGLAVVRRIMRSLGGDVQLESPAGERGCAFHLVFPSRLVRRHDRAVRESVATTRQSSPNPTHQISREDRL